MTRTEVLWTSAGRVERDAPPFYARTRLGVVANIRTPTVATVRIERQRSFDGELWSIEAVIGELLLSIRRHLTTIEIDTSYDARALRRWMRRTMFAQLRAAIGDAMWAPAMRAD